MLAKVPHRLRKRVAREVAAVFRAPGLASRRSAWPRSRRAGTRSSEAQLLAGLHGRHPVLRVPRALGDSHHEQPRAPAHRDQASDPAPAPSPTEPARLRLRVALTQSLAACSKGSYCEPSHSTPWPASSLDLKNLLEQSKIAKASRVTEAASTSIISHSVTRDGSTVPRTLAAKIPNEVPFEVAAFAPLAAIGLQRLRLAEPTLGETFVVIGLGLIGLLTVQILRANGCRVIGIDRDMDRVSLAEDFGAIGLLASEDVADRVIALTGVGADGMLLTLASDANDPIRQAAAMSRKRGRLVLVGVTGLELSRQDFHEKELSFTVSCSYGPGRHDPSYELLARDYPLPFVRWTEQRNFEAVLALMASGKLATEPLITHRFGIEDALAAYDLVISDQPSLGIVLEYGDRVDGSQRAISRQLNLDTNTRGDRSTALGCIGVIGAGNFAVRTLLPVLAEQGARLRVIASGSGTSASLAAQRFGFERAVSDLDAVFEDSEVDTIFILTRHDSHARLVRRGLEAGKHVFVEKPLALNEEELDEVLKVAAGSDGLLMVGFNRRFAPLARRARKHLNGRVGPLSIIVTINAGPMPPDHWTQELSIGGGRIMGRRAIRWTWPGSLWVKNLPRSK